MGIGRRTLLTSAFGALAAGCARPPTPTRPASPPAVRHPVIAQRRPPVGPVAVPSRAEVVARYGARKPTVWSLRAPGTLFRFHATGKVAALTFDACGGRGGNQYDGALIGFLRERSVPATLFINSRWIDENPTIFRQLAADPLFEIANHGTRHLPLSVSGRSAYGIPGTRNVGEVYDEVAGNQAKLTELLGHPPRFFRPGTAYCDDVAAKVVTDLGERFTSFHVNGDGGATFTPGQVREAMRDVRPGSIVISHMNHPHGGTARGMRLAIPDLLDQGYAFVHLP